MADQTNISWTDHTFNAWWGCTKIAPGCDNCYAAAFDKRTGGDYWNAHTQPRRTRVSNWNKAKAWNKQAEIENRQHHVFCGSMMDWCDNKVPDEWRADLFQLIRDTPWLNWQLLTKRATRITKCLPNDWGDGYPNVWLGVTCENMGYGYARIDALRKVPARVRFISAEPLLEHLEGFKHQIARDIDWVIIGGESGPGCRLPEPGWINQAVTACMVSEVPVWFKQHGGTGKDKGGCEILGQEYKQWPQVAA